MPAMDIVPLAAPDFPTVAQEESPFCPAREAEVVLGDDSDGVCTGVGRSTGTGEATGDGSVFESVLNGGCPGAVNPGGIVGVWYDCPGGFIGVWYDCIGYC